MAIIRLSPEQKFIQAMDKIRETEKSMIRVLRSMVYTDLERDVPRLKATLKDETLAIFYDGMHVKSWSYEMHGHWFHDMVNVFQTIIGLTEAERQETLTKENSNDTDTE